MRNLRTLSVVLAGLGLAAVSPASVISLTMRQMLERADSAVVGKIIEKKTWHGPLRGFDDGADFTTLTIEGDDLVKGSTVKHEVTFLGTDARPVSEMPVETDTRVGNKTVVFSQAVNGEWGGRTGLHSLIAAEGGIYRVETGPKGDVVIGRGQGFAVTANAFDADLRKSVAAELTEIRRAKK
jgi:hypothetical protein